MQEKAECLAQYSHVKSNGKLMVVDIQGADYCLTDPEIVTAEGSFDNQGLLFCVGNLGDQAINNFCKSHLCSIFCEQLGLDEKSSESLVGI